MASATHLPVGTLLQGGKYRITRFIGQGGFGCTYAAEHTLLASRVAIKEFFAKDFCNRDGTSGSVTVATESRREVLTTLRRKFVEEARVVFALHHENIVRVLDIFEERGTAYYVMDYVDGMSLREVLATRGALPETEAVEYLRQVAAAIAYVHEHHRLHLDIKPGNIMIDTSGRALLIDFGTSKHYDENSGENTSTLVGVNTPGFAPIEQMNASFSSFAPEADIYALGATLYKCLSGITPPSAVALLSEEEYLAPLPEAISGPTRAAVAAAMQLKRRDRPHSVAQFLALLDGSGEDTVIVNPPPPPPPPTPPPPPPVPVPPTGSDGKKWKALAIGIGIVCAAVIVVCGLYMSKVGTPSVNEEHDSIVVADTIPTYVEDAPMTFRGTSYTYTGPVNAAGLPDGKGKGVYKDGTYEGEYVAGCREGQAHYVPTGGTQSFDGTYKDDEYYEGTLTYSDGTYYKGTFKDNTFDTGTWYNANGTVDGRMKNGKWQ